MLQALTPATSWQRGGAAGQAGRSCRAGLIPARAAIALAQMRYGLRL